MKINFAELKFRPSLFEEAIEIKDFHKQLANAIWQSQEVAEGSFALDLFKSPEIEINDEQKEFIKKALNNFLQWAKRPVLEALGEKEA